MAERVKKMVWELLVNPMSGDIGLSEVILLAAVGESDESSAEEIGVRLKRKWEVVHQREEGFSIVWSTGYDFDTQLIRFKEIGVIQVNGWRDKKPLWGITERGKKFLSEEKANDRTGYVNLVVT